MELKKQCKERFQPAVDAIHLLLEKESDAPVLVAVDGRCGSGKTTLGEYLSGQFECNLFHMDDFFLRPKQRTAERLCEIGGNVDYERFLETVLQPLQEEKTVCYQPFSCKEWKLTKTSEIPFRKLNIIEGSYSMHPYFGSPYALRIFMNISPKEQMENIIRRNGAEKAKEFEEKWIPKEEAYFRKFDIRKGALEINWR